MEGGLMTNGSFTIKHPDHDRSRSLGMLAVAWIEHFCIHGPGDIAGDVVELDDWMAGWVIDSYALTTAGRRFYSECVMSLAKGRAKSEIAAFVVMFDTVGPSRFDGWAKGGETFTQGDFVYTYRRGEPMGKYINTPIARALATEEKQAGNTYDNLTFNFEDSDSPLRSLYPAKGKGALDSGLTRIKLPRGGKIEPSTASAGAKDGGKESVVVFDEVHLFVKQSLQDMYATIMRNLPKRKDAEPWAMITTTMHLDGEGSIGEQLYLQARAIQKGDIPSGRLFYAHVEGDAIEDLSDTDALMVSLLAAYDNLPWIDYDAKIANAFDPKVDPTDFRRFNLNQLGSASNSFLTREEWDGCSVDDFGEPIQPLKRGDIISLGFDGSRGRQKGYADATALIACRLSDMSLHEIHIWEQPETKAGEGWVVPRQEVVAEMHKAFSNYRVVAFFADPSDWENELRPIANVYYARLKVIAGRDNKIFRWMSGNLYKRRNSDDIRDFLTAIRTRGVLHDGSPILTRHAINAKLVKDSDNYLGLYKEFPESPRKIDGIVAAELAYTAAKEALAKGVKPERKSGGKVRVFSDKD
jgi:phage terminase large subunit-like protein